MIASYGRILPLLLLVFVAACSPKSDVYHEQLLVFGTIVDIKLWGVEEEKARWAVAQLSEDFDYMHRSWHPSNQGILNRTNAFLPSGEVFSAGPSILPLIKRSAELSRQSGGLFNPAMGKLIDLWGFGHDTLPKGPPPSLSAIEEILKKNPRMSDIEIDGINMRGLNSSVKLDFGAFAKGYAVDRAIEQLQEMGIHNAVVNAGGDLRVIGRHGDRPWRVGIRHPRQEGMLAAVEVEGDESVFTSGDYERFFEWQGKRYGHIIDPRTGYPAIGVSSVTVFAQQADLADAAATALFVAGPQGWFSVARNMGVKGVMLVDHEGTIHMTPSLQGRIHFEMDPSSDKAKPKVIISDAL